MYADKKSQIRSVARDWQIISISSFCRSEAALERSHERKQR